jgi:hypothetical protein
MLMIPDRGVFFEFVPVETRATSNNIGSWPARVPLWGVEKNKLYAIHVTTPSGLYSYRLGDLVRFTSTRPAPHGVRGSPLGLPLHHAGAHHARRDPARGRAARSRSHPATTVDYGCGADVGVHGTAKSRYVLFVEFEGQAPDMRAFAAAFDEGMRRENRVYREHRDNEVGILAPEAIALPPGSVKRFMKDIGNTSVQSKFPRILDDDRKTLLRSYVAS